MKKKQLKLYVWHDVLCGGYGMGAMFALAYSVEEAREKILQYDQSVEEDLNKEPTVYCEPVGFAVWGSA